MIAHPAAHPGGSIRRALVAAVLVLVPMPRAAAQATPPTAASGARPNPRAPAQLVVRVVPDTVRIGQPFQVVVRIRVPTGATVAFPLGPDSGTAVEALDPRSLSSAPDSSGMDLTATYRLAAWDLGRQSIPFAPVAVHGVGVDGTVPLNNLTILVAATTPADAAHRAPRAARPMFALPRAWWPPWAIAGAILLGIAVIWVIGRWWRKRPRRGSASIDPMVEATREFGALDRVGLLEAGEAGRYVTLAVDVVRTYLVRRVSPASMAQTTAELMDVIGDDARVPLARLRALLAESDRVKFARQPVSVAEARALGLEARGVVADVDRRAAAIAAAAAKAFAAPGPPPSRGPDAGSARRGRAA